MIYYAYDPFTGILQGEGTAEEDPLTPDHFMYPAFATTVVPIEPKSGYNTVFREGAWKYEVIVPDATDPEPENTVETERDRRIDGGFVFQNVLYQTRPDDRENIAGASQLAFAAMVNGAHPGDLRWAGADEDFGWIAENNSVIPMDAETMFAFGTAALAWKKSCIFAAFNIKKRISSGEVFDYTDNSLWPEWETVNA
jgi:hypothetical protein